MKKKSTISLLNKMLIRSLKKGWAQFLSIVAIGAIAVTLFVGLLANADSFENRVNEVYSEGNLASLWVTTTKYDVKDKEEISSLLNEDETIEGRLYLPCKVGSMDIYLAVTPTMPEISKPYGELEASENEKEFLLLDKEFKQNKSLTVANKYEVGGDASFFLTLSSYGISDFADFLDLYLKDGGKNIFKEDTISFDATVTGFMSHPENITKSSYNTSLVLMSDATFKKGITKMLEDNFTSAGVKLIFKLMQTNMGFNSQTSEYLTNPNQYLISVKDEMRVSILKEKINDYFANKEENNLYLTTSRSEMPFYVTINNDVTQARQFTFVFPFVFFAVAILVILTTLSQRILQERSQIGTMKAIGLRKGQIYWHYIRLTGMLVGLGTLIGEIIGPLLIPRILGQKYSILYSLPTMNFVFPVWEGILTAVVFLGVSALVTFLICHKEISLKPVESMRPEPPKFKYKHVSSSKKDKVNKLSLKMAFRNIRINKVKSLMVIIGVLGCTALLCCGFGIEDTVDNGIEHDLNMFYNTDMSISYKMSSSAKEIRDDLLSYSGVKSVDPYIMTSTSLFVGDGAQAETRIYVIQKDTDTISMSFDHNKVAITQKVANKTGAKVGDTIHFTYNTVSYEAEIALIQEAFVYHGIYVYTDAPFLKGEDTFTYNTAYVKVNSDSNVSEIADNISKNDSNVAGVTTYKQRREMIQDVMSGVYVMTNAVKVFAILLAIVVLYNLALMNFQERTRDIATLKVLGFSRHEIALSLLFETMSLTALGVILGLFLGYPFMLAVLGTNVVELVEYLYSITVISYIISFALTFVVAFIVNLLLTRRIKKVLMVESLKSVE